MKSFLYERGTSVPQLKDLIFFQTPKINFLRRYETRYIIIHKIYIIMHKMAITFFSKRSKSYTSSHLIVKFYGEQFCRTSLSPEKSFKGLKIDFFDKTPTFHRNLHKNGYNFFLGGQKSYTRCHFISYMIVKFYGEQFCRTPLSPKNHLETKG
jgi:hypothetical protein